MSDATERPAADADAWAEACAEDLAAERARRREQQYGHGGGTGSAAEELRKLMDAVADRVSSLQNPLFGMAAQGAVQQMISQAKAAVEPVIERNPQVFDHLAAAGSELLAAYRSAVEGHERRWTRGDTQGVTPDEKPGGTPGERRDGPDDGPREQIDLD
ncbi:DUF5304 domain-containing protein [Streptomyces sp. SCSIO 30461]|uniref:DUF5304 domain-containing protein n=1 Tax=Streptomyces sp. SCSIO 30461 TaxID=3118085 RepID=UPI0030D1B85D